MFPALLYYIVFENLFKYNQATTEGISIVNNLLAVKYFFNVCVCVDVTTDRI